jgi:hydrogenase maturation protein HypF
VKTIRLPFRLKKSVLACGADIKGAFALAEGDTAYLVDGFGDLADPDNLERYEKAVGALEKKLKIKPKVIVRDLHPGYFSTRFAESLRLTTYDLRLCKVQHHEAHIASAIVDNAVKGDVIGVAFDGTGFGTDGNIWGGEVFVGNLKKFRRAAHLEYVAMPGADAAVREPWRMAASYLYKAYGNNFLKKLKKGGRALFIKAMIDKKINSPLTSSAGRLFDAVGSIVLEKEDAAFEAELPIELEKIAAKDNNDAYTFGKGDSHFLGQASTVIKAIMNDMEKKTDRAVIAAKFHNAVANLIVSAASAIRKNTGTDKVVLSGGVFQNKYLSAKAADILKDKGFKVYRHRGINTNDSGIPIGQIAIAQARGICA